MSKNFREGALTFSFPNHWEICRPEFSSFYDRHFSNFCDGCKEVDFLAFDPQHDTIWFIEVKDYRVHQRLKETHLADEVARKTRDVIAMLPVARIRDNGISSAQQLEAGDFWRRAMNAASLRVVLHCELPENTSKLFPGVKDAANLQTKLAQKLRVIDPHALFTNRALGHSLPWAVASA
jgi:hypothetical protein